MTGESQLLIEWWSNDDAEAMGHDGNVNIRFLRDGRAVLTLPYEGALIVVQLGVDEVRDLSDKAAYARRTADRADEARMLNTYVEDAR